MLLLLFARCKMKFGGKPTRPIHRHTDTIHECAEPHTRTHHYYSNDVRRRMAQKKIIKNQTYDADRSSSSLTSRTSIPELAREIPSCARNKAKTHQQCETASSDRRSDSPTTNNKYLWKKGQMEAKQMAINNSFNFHFVCFLWRFIFWLDFFFFWQTSETSRWRVYRLRRSLARTLTWNMLYECRSVAYCCSSGNCSLDKICERRRRTEFLTAFNNSNTCSRNDHSAGGIHTKTPKHVATAHQNRNLYELGPQCTRIKTH